MWDFSVTHWRPESGCLRREADCTGWLLFIGVTKRDATYCHICVNLIEYNKKGEKYAKLDKRTKTSNI